MKTTQINELTELIRKDMRPALGVTEPGAIAFAVSKARSLVEGKVSGVELTLNSGMYKNAYTCGIPNSRFMGNEYAAALGVIAGRPEKGLECLADVREMDNAMAEMLVRTGRIQVHMGKVTSRIFIEAKVTAESGEAVVTIRDSHTNIVSIRVNGETVFEKTDEEKAETAQAAVIHSYTLEEICEYAKTVPAEDISFIAQAYEMNCRLFEAGLESDRTTYGKYLLEKNGGEIISDDEQKTASLLCNAAIEARVTGLDYPAMSITGSGAHGIIATMPLYAAYKVKGYSEESLLRAAALSDLVCMYIKEYSGKLSAFCGCAIAAGTGMACGLVLLRGGSTEEMSRTIDNMASSITGMICDGGNQGCAMKGVVAVDAAYRSAAMAMKNVYIYPVHGINGPTPEETMRNMGQIASPGMVGTEKTIVEILEHKSAGR